MDETAKSSNLPESSISSSEGELKIDENRLSGKRPRSSQKSRRKRKRKRTKTDSGEEQIDMAIEQTIQSCMQKNKELNHLGIKRILRKLVRNEHVLAIVRLREEELAQKCEEQGSEADDEDEEAVTIKLTRAKARELDQDLLLMPLKPQQDQGSQALAMLQQDFHDDDTDPEYKPEEDEPCMTTDVDSLPATPRSSSTKKRQDEVQYSEDGKFKIPSVRAGSVTQSEGEEEPIFKRTRTKLCFKEATVEDLLLSNDPDCTSDMYNVGYEVDDSWRTFLNEFFWEPYNPNADDAEDDNDPEFNPVEEAETERLDKDEMKDVEISKTEYNLLVKELLEMVDKTALAETIDLPEEREMTPPLISAERKLRSPRSNRRLKSNSSRKAELHTPTHMNETVEESVNESINETANESSFKPDLMSTISEEKESLSVFLQTSMFASPVKICNVTPKVSTPDYQEFMIRIPTENLMDCGELILQTLPKSQKDITVIDTPPKVPKAQLVEETKVIECTDARLAFFDFAGQPVLSQQPGFLPFQNVILGQQIRMHVQLCTQHFLQTYAHPKLWQNAALFEKMLKDLRSKKIVVENLKDGFKLMSEWKKDMNDPAKTLGVETIKWFSAEQSFAEEQYEQKLKFYRCKLAPEIMRRMFVSPVIVYPHLLPTCAFRYCSSRVEKQVYGVGEEALMALGLEVFYDEQFVRRVKGIKPSLVRWCNTVSSRMLHRTRNPKCVYNQINSLRKSETYNAITHYFLEKRAPCLFHKLYEAKGPPVNWTVKDLKEPWQTYAVQHEDSTWKTSKTAPEKAFPARSEASSELTLKVVQPVEDIVQPVRFEIIFTPQKGLSAPVLKPVIGTKAERRVSDEEDVPLSLRKQKTPKQDTSLIRKRKRSAEKVLNRLLNELKSVPKEVKNNPKILAIFEHFRTIETFSSLLVELRKICEASTLLRVNIPKNCEIMNHKRAKIEEKRLLNKAPDENPDAVYAMNFVDKVEEALMAQNNQEDYDKFLEILKSFDASTEKVADLYFKLEEIFHPKYPDLLNLFLTFLLPGQAAEVGKFFEHFMLQNMTTFKAKLAKFFAKQPGQIRKIYACLNELAKIDHVSMETVKESVLPLLKGNPVLSAWFLQIFPNERPADCDETDSEIVFFRKGDTDGEVYEDFVISENPSTSAEPVPSCGVKYLASGIVFNTLPARLSFLAYDALLPKEPRRTFCAHAVKEEDSVEGPAARPGELRTVDNNVLKAHAIRLNPAVHARNGESYKEVVELLTTPASVAEKYFNEVDAKSSPRKGASKARKLSMSPKSKLIRSPKASGGPVMKAKKLKNMVEQEKPVEVKQEAEETPEWTREEDKIILEEQKQASRNARGLIERLKEKLPNRPEEEIQKRLDFLMDILRKIQNKGK